MGKGREPMTAIILNWIPQLLPGSWALPWKLQHLHAVLNRLKEIHSAFDFYRNQAGNPCGSHTAAGKVGYNP